MHYALIVTATLSLLHAVHAALLIGGLLAASADAQTQHHLCGIRNRQAPPTRPCRRVRTGRGRLPRIPTQTHLPSSSVPIEAEEKRRAREEIEVAGGSLIDAPAGGLVLHCVQHGATERQLCPQ